MNRFLKYAVVGLVGIAFAPMVLAQRFLFGAAGVNAPAISNREPFALPVPLSGGYYDPARSGNGQMLDVASNGYVFQTWFTYEASGQPSFFSLQGRLARPQGVSGCPADVSRYCHGQRVEWAQSGLTWSVTDEGTVPASTDMRLYKSQGGACPTCPQTSPATAPDKTNGPVKLEFFGDIQKLTSAGNRTLVSEPLLPFWRDSVLKKLTGADGRGRTFPCWYENFPGALEEFLGAAQKPRLGECSATQNGAYFQTAASFDRFVIFPTPPAGLVVDPRFSMPVFDPNTRIVDMGGGSPTQCAALFIGLRPPAILLEGQFSGSQCQFGTVGELFVSGDRAVLWRRGIFRTPGQPIRIAQSFSFDLATSFQ